MEKALKRRINREIRAIERAALRNRLPDARILQILGSPMEIADEPLRICVTEPFTEPFPEKMELITALMDFMEKSGPKFGMGVLCSVYGEHLIGEAGELVYIQVKEAQKVSHRILRIERERFSVNVNGQLRGKIKTERFVNYENK